MNLKSAASVSLRILLLAVALLLINGLGSRFLPSPDAAMAAEPAAPGSGFLGLVFGLMLAQTIALAYPVLRSRWHGWCLAAAVATIYFGTVTFMSQIESLIYLGGKMPEGMLAGLFLMGLFNAIAFAPLAVAVLGRWREDPEAAAATPAPQSPSWWASRIAIGGLVFLALYYLFGYYIAWQSPEVRAYYGGEDPGSFFAQMASVVSATPWMLPFQFLRGLLWVGLGVLVVRSMRTAWWEAGLAASLLFAVPSLYLLLPNDLMPEAVRQAHLIETLPYQFLFGWLVAWLLRPKTASPSSRVESAAGAHRTA